ncbi:uncharacterized mitochondrial protein AtMg00810-like [Rosa chinensis]|uniref:uncharacterized mitochondrial protein AtMg00810-like n=1 Tax=Rosa chinensis TaxID=74649 RepID=UPI000D090FFC|nr:uncharacterized mitochondrial protein AtMg00810-like [Rosa chinensis]
MKDLGDLRYFLGIEVARGSSSIFLRQRKYVLDLLSETGMLDCRPADTLIEQNHRLAEYPDQVPVSVVSQFMQNPSEDHMDAVVRILRYLKRAPGKGLMFSKHNCLEVSGYTDADWAGCITDRRSTSGYFTFVGGNLVTWKSKKQKVVARSSAEAEYRGMAHGHVEVDRHFIKEKLDANLIAFPFVPTKEQLADILTKGVSVKAFHDSLNKLGIRDVYVPT